MNFKRSIYTVLIAVASSVLTIVIYNSYNQKTSSFSQNQAYSKIGRLAAGNYNITSVGQVDFTYAAAMTTPTVVHIQTEFAPKNTASNNSADPFKQFFGDGFNFGDPQPDPYHSQPEEASGSGVIISNDGYIVTNNHVIDGGDKVSVQLFDKRNYTAKVVGVDPNTDLALLKIDASNLPYITFANSDSSRVGQWVLAVGNPFDLESTVTAGIVSAKGRDLHILKGDRTIEDYIQTDAAVNPGNSGGALVNTHGELIGINSAIASPTGAYAGYAFAIPSNLVNKVVNDIMKYGNVQRGYLGVQIGNINDSIAKSNNLSTLDGALVADVNTGSAADKAGVKTGDVITAINGSAVGSSEDVIGKVAELHPGENVAITVIRAGQTKVLNANLSADEGKSNIVTMNLLGGEFQNLNSNELSKYGIKGGVKVTQLSDGALTRNTDMHEGFIVTKVDGKPIANVDDLKSALQGKKGGTLLEGFYPDSPNQTYYYGFGL
jgi:serine protease Do